MEYNAWLYSGFIYGLLKKLSMEKTEIRVGQIWEVTDDNFFASLDMHSLKTKRDARFHIKKGEKIEIRYAFEWNYRTEDNFYVHSVPDYILEKCKLIGKVNEKTKSSNKASLEEILRLELYDAY